MPENITVGPSPHIGKPLSTRKIMIDVIIGLMPAIAAAGYYFRIRAAVLIVACVACAVLTEWLCNIIRKKPNSLNDFSAVVTGIILALSLPPALPVWAAIIGSCFAVAIGKMVFGGLGANIFNPAMVGRTFLTACFGMLMTTWTVPASIDPAMPAIRPDNTAAVTQATPLAWSKEAIKSTGTTEMVDEQLKVAFTGSIGGCLGETSAIALLLGGVYLLARRTINIHIPLAAAGSAAFLAWVFNIIDADTYIRPVLHLTTGGMLLCIFFIATDPVTAPLSTKGMWIFGAGVGAITIVIRIFGEYPEGVMYAVLLMNGATPLIDRFCKLVPAGGKPHVS